MRVVLHALRMSNPSDKDSMSQCYLLTGYQGQPVTVTRRQYRAVAIDVFTLILSELADLTQALGADLDDLDILIDRGNTTIH
jgi:hypothetical protein